MPPKNETIRKDKLSFVTTKHAPYIPRLSLKGNFYKAKMSAYNPQLLVAAKNHRALPPSPLCLRFSSYVRDGPRVKLS